MQPAPVDDKGSNRRFLMKSWKKCLSLSSIVHLVCRFYFHPDSNSMSRLRMDCWRMAAASRTRACWRSLDLRWAAMWPDHHRSSPPKMRLQERFSFMRDSRSSCKSTAVRSNRTRGMHRIKDKTEQKSRFQRRSQRWLAHECCQIGLWVFEPIVPNPKMDQTSSIHIWRL